ncbi:MalY/PatB family protein [Caldisericum exile]|uniref:cysteine-S-conjugate beta-lyase n=1 Tax=Caldisericum exile (strain DSM 21853 / NBRC 104410 / AZM16c01) TaxID=511051 RepID=A0A7U6GE15_CALEA|nr:MalY/PatB family protein [Caldisericum exile]BAL80666.1 putative cystathionine beta-lyase [Caldisericum exile AZM16c01]
MKYNFDEVVERIGTASYKWDGVKMIFGDSNVLPMWVADMDFKIAKPITDAILKRAEHEIYGYTTVPDSLIEAVIERLKRKYDWDVKPEWLVFTPGVVPALYTAVKAFATIGDSVLVQEPVYYPFFHAIRDNGAHIVSSDLKLVDDHYEIDFDDLERKFLPRQGLTPTPQRIRAMIMSNPHNPVGRVFTKEELERIGEIVLKHDAVMISDEIHCEIVYKGHKHIPFATISKEFRDNSITCMSASKTFNLAGLETSFVIIPSDKLRARFIEAKGRILSTPNAFGLVAMEAAFRCGDEWLSQLLEYLEENLNFLKDFVEKRIPKVKVIKPEGTYLAWLDFRELGMNEFELSEFLRKKALVGLDDGYIFGESGKGFARLNFATPRVILEEGLRRIEKAIKEIL